MCKSGGFTVKPQLDEYFQLKEQVDALTARMDAIKAELKKDMEFKGKTEYEEGPYSLKLVTSTTVTINRKALEKAYPEIAQKYANSTMSTRFYIKKVDPK